MNSKGVGSLELCASLMSGVEALDAAAAASKCPAYATCSRVSKQAAPLEQEKTFV